MLLKIKNETGQYVQIPHIRGEQGIKGEKGDKGDKGDPFALSHVYSSELDMNLHMTEMETGELAIIVSTDSNNGNVYVKNYNSMSKITNLANLTTITAPTDKTVVELWQY